MSNVNIKKVKYLFLSVQHNQIYLFCFIVTTCFGQLTVMRPFTQKTEQDATSANNIFVLLDSMKLKKDVSNHIKLTHSL